MRRVTVQMVTNNVNIIRVVIMYNTVLSVMVGTLCLLVLTMCSLNAV
jgi:hypothetical protein